MKRNIRVLELTSIYVIASKASFLSARGIIVSWVYHKNVPARVTNKGNLVREYYWRMIIVYNVSVREALMREVHWPVGTDCSTAGHPSWRFGNLQDKPHGSVEVGGGGEEVSKVLLASRRTAPS